MSLTGYYLSRKKKNGSKLLRLKNLGVNGPMKMDIRAVLSLRSLLPMERMKTLLTTSFSVSTVK